MKSKNNQKIKKNATHGFTLIELLIAIVIIGVLAAVALPTYTNYMNRNKLADAVSNLHDLRMRMEQYYQDNRSYLNGAACGIAMPALDEFTLTCDNAARRTYTITAKSKANVGLGSVGDYEYTINQDGVMATVKFAGDNVNLTCLRIGASC